MLADAPWCLPLPTGASCAYGAGMTSGCTCLAAWLPVWVEGTLHCDPPSCQSGFFFNVNASTVVNGVSGCTPCPPDTYLSGYSCSKCPVNYGTMGLSARTSLDDCVCNAGVLIAVRSLSNTTQHCGTCPKNAVYDAVTRSCRACPAGMSAAASGSYCVCPGTQQ